MQSQTILKNGRYELEDKVNALLHKFDIKRESFNSKLNGVNCRKLMKHHIDIINGINDTFIEVSKGDVYDFEITNKTDKYKNLLKEVDNYDIYFK